MYMSHLLSSLLNYHRGGWFVCMREGSGPVPGVRRSSRKKSLKAVEAEIISHSKYLQQTMSTQFDPEKAENLEDIEKQFAVKAVKQAMTYWSLLELIGGSKLKLTQHDDEIYETFLEDFPEYKDVEKVKVISEDEMKSPEGKKRWRVFCEKFNEIDDYNFGTLLRLDSSQEYDQDSTMFAVRIQFYAIEIARNRAGLNDWIKK